MATVHAAKRMVKVLFGKLTIRQDHHLDVLKTSISLVLVALSHAQVQSLLSETSVMDVFGMCEEIMWQWVANNGVIGGSFFGGSIRTTWTRRNELLYALSEIKVQQYSNSNCHCTCVTVVNIVEQVCVVLPTVVGV